MKILITGATGLIGSEIVALCLSQNIAINYLTTSKKKIVSKDNYQGFYWNPKKNEIDTNAFKGVTAIINLAGASVSKRWTPAYKQEIILSRVDSLKTLYSALEENKNNTVNSIVSASGIGVYPNSFENYYTEEEKEVDTSFLGEVVIIWEREINKFKQIGLKVSIVRIGLVLSCKGGALPEIIKPIKYYVGAPFGTGMHWQSWIHITDLSRIFLYVLQNNLEGIYNGVAPNPVINSKFTRQVAKLLNRPLFLPNVPAFVMKLILGEMSYLLFASQRVSSKKIQEEGFNFIYNSLYTALEKA